MTEIELRILQNQTAIMQTLRIILYLTIDPDHPVITAGTTNLNTVIELTLQMIGDRIRSDAAQPESSVMTPHNPKVAL